MEIGGRSAKQSEPIYITGIDWAGQDQAGRWHRSMVGEPIDNAGQSKMLKQQMDMGVPGHLLKDKAPVSKECKSISR